MKTIDLENHFSTPFWAEVMKNNQGYPRIDQDRGIGYWEDTWIPVTSSGVSEKLADLGEGRLKLMDECGIDYAHLSFVAPGSEPFDPETSKKVAKDANDTLAEAIAKYPDRFGGFVTLAPKDPDWSIKELERGVNDLGLFGWHTHSNFGDSYLDEKTYWPILQKCEELDMPIYLHPASTTAKELRTFGISLAGPALGFGVDVQYCFLRMILRGVFDAFPKLKVILGHFGEALPFLIDRVDVAHRQGFGQPKPEIGGGYKHEPSYYLKNNMWTTTSGNYLPEALFCTRDALGMDRVMLGTDHPFEEIHLGVDMIVKDVPLPDNEKEAYLNKNAKTLGFAQHI